MAFQSRHLPSLASNHQVLFVKSCTSRQSSIIHLTCVSPVLNLSCDLLQQRGLAALTTALWCLFTACYRATVSHDRVNESLSPMLLGKISVQPFFRRFSQPLECVFVFGFSWGTKKKKLLLRDTVPLGPLTPHFLWQRNCYERRMPEPFQASVCHV